MKTDSTFYSSTNFIEEVWLPLAKQGVFANSNSVQIAVSPELYAKMFSLPFYNCSFSIDNPNIKKEWMEIGRTRIYYDLDERLTVLTFSKKS